MTIRPPLHPACAAWPAMTDSNLASLAADIEQNGLLHPIVLMPDGSILDGRSRWDACKMVDVTPRTVLYEDDDPVGFTLSQNKHRRHLDLSQLAIVTANLERVPRGGDRKSRNAIIVARNDYDQNPNAPKTRKTIAEQSGVNMGYLSHGRYLIDNGHPNIVAMVKVGEVPIRQAYDAVRTHKDQPDLQASWTAADVKAIGARVKKDTYAKDKPADTTPTKVHDAAPVELPKPKKKIIDVPYSAPFKSLTPEQAGKPPSGASSAERDAHAAKYGRVQLHPKVVKDLLDFAGPVEALSLALQTITNKEYYFPKDMTYAEGLRQMLAYIPDKSATNGAQIDFAAKARIVLARLEKIWPKLFTMMAELDAIQAEIKNAQKDAGGEGASIH